MAMHLRLALTILLVFCAVFSFRSPPAYAGGGYGIVFSTGNYFDGDAVGEVPIISHPVEAMAFFSKRELELYEIYIKEMYSAMEEKRMPEIDDEFILELFENTTLLMMFSILSLGGI